MNKRFWSGHIKDLTPYVPGEQPRDRTYIKLNTNENPYPPAPGVERVLRGFPAEELRLYPDPETMALRTVLGKRYGLPPEMVFVGNGSDELLAFVNLAFMDESTPAIFPDVTYSFYPVYAALFGNNVRVVPVREDFTIPTEELMKNDGTVLLTNPNAPTGMALPLTEIERIIKANPDHVVVVDEAYVDFGAESAAPLTTRYPNLLVIQTFSKSRSLAGLRVGFAFGSHELIAALDTVKNSFNSYTADRLALAAAQAAAEDQVYTDDTCRRIAKTREWTDGKLSALGFRVLPSQANFLFASHPEAPAGEIFLRLRQQGILVRYFEKPRIDNFLRITIGREEDMETLVTAMKEILEELS